MSIIKTKAGNVDVLIEAINPINQNEFSGMEDSANQNNMIGNIQNVFQNARSAIDGIVGELSDAASQFNPDEVKIGFSISLTTEGNLWMIKSSGNATFNVELTWRKEDRA